MLDAGRDAGLLAVAACANQGGVVIDDGAWFAGHGLRQGNCRIQGRCPGTFDCGNPREWDDIGNGPYTFGCRPEYLEGR